MLAKKRLVLKRAVAAINLELLEAHIRAVGSAGITARGYGKKHKLDPMIVLKALGKLYKKYRRHGLHQEWVPCSDFAIQQGRYWFQKDDNG